MGEPLNKKLRKFSPITHFLERIFDKADGYSRYAKRWLYPRKIIEKRVDCQDESETKTQTRGTDIEYQVLQCIAISLVLFSALSLEPYLLWLNYQPRMSWMPRIWSLVHFLAFLFALLRLIDIVQVSFNVVLFDRLREDPDKPHPMSSLTRSLVLTMINYFELILLFALIYLSYPEMIDPKVGPGDALYFSVITQLTIGYGDLTPVGFGKMFAAIQGIAGIVFAIYVLARFISSLPPIQTVLGDGPYELGHPKETAVNEKAEERQMVEALNRILTAICGTHWHTGKSIEELRFTLRRAVKAVAAAHRQVDERVALSLDSLSREELYQLIDKLDLPGKFPDAKLE